MSIREGVQVLALIATFISCIILVLTVVPLAAISISFAGKFNMISPERTSWKIGINAMFITLALSFNGIFSSGVKGKKRNTKYNPRVFKERWFAMFVAVYDFICFLGSLIGTILLIITIIQYPGKWESVENNERRIDYEIKSGCCLLYQKDEPLIFKDCPLVNTTNDSVDFTNCKKEYNFFVCDKKDLNISDNEICPDVPKEDYPLQICSIVIGSILTFIYFLFSVTFFVTYFLDYCCIPRLNMGPP